MAAPAEQVTGIAVPALTEIPRTTEGAKVLYDQWADTYDDALKSWDYQVPRRIAEVLTQLGGNAKTRILDIGCGTGLSGEAVHAARLGTEGGIIGVDISSESLPLAMAKGCYENAVVGNLDEPLAMDSGGFDAIISVGVFSYVEKFDTCFDEMVRLSRPGALFIFSHRANWWAEDYRGCRTAADSLEKAGKWKLVHEGEAEPYLPNNPNPEEAAMTIRIIAYKVSGIAVDALTDIPRTTEGAKVLYDQWANTYDDALKSWDYQVPRRIAEVLAQLGGNAKTRILDIGCGTGLSGEAVHAAKLGTEGGIIGVDISAESLPLAMAKGCYENAVVGNLDEPLALDSGVFDAIISVGVFSYVEKFDTCFDEVVRLSRPGALFIFSHRANWWAEDYRGCRTAADSLEKAGKWKLVHEGEAEPYLPNNPNPEEAAMTIRIIAYKVSGIVLDATKGAKVPYDQWCCTIA